MADNNTTIFQRLTYLVGGGASQSTLGKVFPTAPAATTSDNDVILRTNDKAEYERALLAGKQQNFLARQWRRADYNITTKTISNLTNIKMMFRDADLMDDFPEIGAALDIMMEESCVLNNDGFMLNIASKSERVKKILEDLFYNVLAINTNLPMISRAMCKYGNDYMLLNIDKDNGIIGWRKLPVYEIERYENGMINPYAAQIASSNQINDDTPLETQFIWVGGAESTFIPYKNWQIAHFRLLYDSKFLPYGVSALQKARRHFRMLSMMEDLMLVYRMERSWERRVFKINVGGIDPEDVPAYVQEVANNFKRTPIVDPETGQLDLRKNIMGISEDYFIPVREDGAPNPIETLQGAQNLTAMDDIKFIENKVLTALRVPKSFINFDTEKSEGKNLSLLDVRFARTVNRIQQYLIMELNKIAITHLYILGFHDDLTNFTLSMNNPSSQAEMLEIENLSKKITTAKDAVTDPGGGIPLYSMTMAWKDILKWSDSKMKDNLEELRLERALAAELEATAQIIKRTHIFDPIDNIYGEIGAEYSQGGQEGDGEGGDAMGGGGGGFGGGGLDFGGEDMGGETGEMDMGDAAAEEMGGEGDAAAEAPADGGAPEALAESVFKTLDKSVINRKKQIAEEISKKQLKYQARLLEHIMKDKPVATDTDDTEIVKKGLFVNDEMNTLYESLAKRVDSDDEINNTVSFKTPKESLHD